MTAQGEKKSDNKSPVSLWLVSRLFDLAEDIVRYGIIPFFVWLCVRELAGQETVVNVVINYFSKKGNFFPWGFATGTILWALGERKLRHIKTERMSKHLAELERRLDSGRTSSGLTPTGQSPRHRYSQQTKEEDTK